MQVAHEVTLRASYFTMGSVIQYGWFQGKVVGINFSDMTQLIQVQTVLIPRPGRTVGSKQRIPFNTGKEIHNGNEYE